MPGYKPVHRDPLLLPVVLAEQVQPGTFEFALDHLVDHELDLSGLDARFRNDQTGASAYDPRVMLKIVLLAYSRGLISSRRIEQACQQNVLFMAVSGDSQPGYTHIAKFVRELGEQILPLFTQILLTCDRQGLIGRQMFAIDGVKLPSNASKERSGTHGELRHRAERLDKAARKMIELHRSRDDGAEESAPDAQRQQRIEALQKEAQATRDFLAREGQRRNRKGQELKSNVTDNDSATMATSQGVIQGYAAQAAVDASHQVIVAADVRSGSEQCMTRRARGRNRSACSGRATSSSTSRPTAASARPAAGCTAVAAAARSTGAWRTNNKGTKAGCGSCELRAQCLRHPERTDVRQVAMFAKVQPGAHVATELMKRAIDSARGRSLYSQRIATVEPVFANLRHNKRLDRFTVRGKEKVGTQWRLYCMVHNIEKLARTGYRDERK